MLILMWFINDLMVECVFCVQGFLDFIFVTYYFSNISVILIIYIKVFMDSQHTMNKTKNDK